MSNDPRRPARADEPDKAEPFGDDEPDDGTDAEDDAESE